MNTEIRFAFAGLLAATALGCSTTPNWDARFGEPVRIIAAQQVLDPDASRNADPVNGIDGKAAHGAMGEYAKSFTTPEPQPDIITIGIGNKGR